MGLATEAVGHIFHVGARVSTNHGKPLRPPPFRDAGTGDLVAIGHLTLRRAGLLFYRAGSGEKGMSAGAGGW